MLLAKVEVEVQVWERCDTKLERPLLVFWINFLSEQKEDMAYKIFLS